jgi:hypothetical protein
VLGSNARCLFRRLARAMTTNIIFKMGMSNIVVRISLGLTVSNGHNFGPSMTDDV